MQVPAIVHSFHGNRVMPLEARDRIAAIENAAAAPTDLLHEIDPRVIEELPDDGTRVSDSPEGDGEKTRGVIRLLESGHFNGVADVRLRINFFDELSARAEAAAAPLIEEGATELVSQIEAKVGELLEAFATDAEARSSVDGLVAEFSAAVELAVEQAASEDSFDRDSLAGALQSAFDDFVGSVAELLASAATGEDTPDDTGDTPDPDALPGTITTLDVGTGDREAFDKGSDLPDRIASVTGSLSAEPLSISAEAVGGVVDDTGRITLDVKTAGIGDATTAIDGTDPDNVGPIDRSGDIAPEQDGETSLTLDDALASLAELFQQGFSSFLQSIDDAIRLPDPSAPTGQGGAYDKFLAIYNDLRGIDPTFDERA